MGLPEQKRGIDGIKIALASLIIVLVGVSGFLYSQVNSLNAQVTSLSTQVNSSNSQVISLSAPKLITAGFGYTVDHNPNQGYFIVLRGVVVNIGRNTAYHCKIHVVVYDVRGALGNVVIDANIDLGNINGGDWNEVLKLLFYGGGNPGPFIIEPQWLANT